MRKTFIVLLAAGFLLGAPALAHEPALSRETLKSLFPEAENFVNRKKTLTPEQIAGVEDSSGDQTLAADRNLNIFVAVARDPQTGKMKSIGAALMVDAKGSRGMVDMVLACNLDGSIRKILIVQNQDDKALESEAFLGQLVGKGPGDGWDAQKDFRLAGDPESARAVIRAARRGMYLFLAFMS